MFRFCFLSKYLLKKVFQGIGIFISLKKISQADCVPVQVLSKAGIIFSGSLALMQTHSGLHDISTLKLTNYACAPGRLLQRDFKEV